MNKVLLVFPYFYPAYKAGGPVRSAVNLINLLGSQYLFDVFTSDRDLGDKKPFLNVNLDSWDNKFFTANIFYSTIKRRKLFFLRKVLSRDNYDYLYINSFFDYQFSIMFLILFRFGLIKAEKLILAPRGELTDGAMSIKTLKKNFYLKIFKTLNLDKNVVFHFTSEEERKQSLRNLGSSNKNIVAPNMHGDYPDFIEKNKNIGEVNVLFLSRVSPKKNLLVAIKALSRISSGKVNFTIAGEIDAPEYWEECLKEISNLPNNICVDYIGAIDQNRVSVELAKSQLFILPTLNENYGHAIVEAMMYSNIVLISDQTPWSDVSNHGGLVVYNQDLDAYCNAIDKIILLDKIIFNQRTKKIYNYCDAILQSNIVSINKIFNN